MNEKMNKKGLLKIAAEALEHEVAALVQLILHLAVGAVAAVALGVIAGATGLAVERVAGWAAPEVTFILKGVKLVILGVDVVVVLCVVVRAALAFLADTVVSIKKSIDKMKSPSKE